jgi:membrane-associated phospholipid phosphatase
MYSETYEKISAPLRAHPRGVRAIVVTDKVLVAVVALGYVGALIWLAIGGDARFLRVLLVPAISFAAMSATRAVINAPRPYEADGIDPLIKKDTQGKSFPGRHVFSAAVIACALAYLQIGWGITAFVATAVIAIVRVVGGVHYPRDVIAGAVLGILCGIIGFVLIP